jgi:hypothetical protein
MGRVGITPSRLRSCPRTEWAYPLGGNVCDLEIQYPAMNRACFGVVLAVVVAHHERSLELASSGFEQRDYRVTQLTRGLVCRAEAIDLDAVELGRLRAAHVVIFGCSYLGQPNCGERIALKP